MKDIDQRCSFSFKDYYIFFAKTKLRMVLAFYFYWSKNFLYAERYVYMRADHFYLQFADVHSQSYINTVFGFSSRIWNNRAISVQQTRWFRVQHAPPAAHTWRAWRGCLALQNGRVWRENASETEAKHATSKTRPLPGNEGRKRWLHLVPC